MSSIYLRNTPYQARVLFKAPYLHGYLVLAEYERNTPIDAWKGIIDHKKRLVLILNYSSHNHQEENYYHNEAIFETIVEMLNFIQHTISNIENTYPIPYTYQYMDLLILKHHITKFQEKHPEHDHYVKDLYSNTIG